MAEPLFGPNQAYSVRFLASRAGEPRPCKPTTAAGEPLPAAVVTAVSADGADPWPQYLVTLPGYAAFRLRACPGGLTISDLRVEARDAVTIQASVAAGPTAPESLPDSADYVVYHGPGRAAPESLHIRFRRERPPLQSCVSVERLVSALGRSIARANDHLTRRPGAGGVALATSITLRVAVDQFVVTTGERALLRTARPGQTSDQHLEITMTTVPCTEAEDET